MQESNNLGPLLPQPFPEFADSGQKYSYWKNYLGKVHKKIKTKKTLYLSKETEIAYKNCDAAFKKHGLGRGLPYPANSPKAITLEAFYTKSKYRKLNPDQIKSIINCHDNITTRSHKHQLRAKQGLYKNKKTKESYKSTNKTDKGFKWQQIESLDYAGFLMALRHIEETVENFPDDKMWHRYEQIALIRYKKLKKCKSDFTNIFGKEDFINKKFAVLKDIIYLYDKKIESLSQMKISAKIRRRIYDYQRNEYIEIEATIKNPTDYDFKYKYNACGVDEFWKTTNPVVQIPKVYPAVVAVACKKPIFNSVEIKPKANTEFLLSVKINKPKENKLIKFQLTYDVLPGIKSNILQYKW